VPTEPRSRSARPGPRTVDIGFVHDGQDPVDARVFFRAGLIDFVFRSVSLGGGLIVLDPVSLDVA
jgi:hypothetical protein